MVESGVRAVRGCSNRSDWLNVDHTLGASAVWTSRTLCCKEVRKLVDFL